MPSMQDSRFENPLVRQRSTHLGDPPPPVLWQSHLLPYVSSFAFKKMLHILPNLAQSYNRENPENQKFHLG
jgi:hypothetical protein